ncbi:MULTISPECIES: polysaccharide biosynthesis/export family protein [Bradyrhizobium]|jgi:polysaccharide biosynthesis/export protein|uniref:Exopolysaccharide biosynthesis protein n=1 Tax=Bradyrhizobium diazoefficiens TaxID=1355477 RepID=A0A809X9I8_9BRAD|nr:polysaccharide biosynthesis/export family protein [Bradyrhizobium diazoefficiens]AWO93194.1 exopolysaccharide biosynthesis protein [Bradyrhizobium diazoefficiens]WLA76415.1 polysaccharide biosynthesis/export family protein [Bradyrhizobium diazoefficiens]BCE24266.1 exopolysaccharide biosynthesis protein [Bradyrhizobium diazoefficiens]BCE50523.1 exopolysaccharide biosynthesis protein [Bradyrhizobium diazoefficiens]BCE94026.1 exopolysaccharide biosynthesis protein [Bradyrhizobium diazoefficien
MPNSRLRNSFHVDVSGSDLGRCIKWILVAIGLTISVTQAKAEYLVDIGDVLEVAVAGVPELRHRAAVQMDGNVSLPLVGTLPVAGLPLPQIRAKIGAALASKVFRQRASDGRETVVVIDANEITTVIAEYRPIYVNGDVSKPGEYPYRPSITARQLVAVAGGYDIMRIRMNNPYLESADLRSEYGSLWTELAKEQARMWRIKTELGEGAQISPGALMDPPLARSAISEIVNSEKEYLKTKQSDYQQEKTFLQSGIRQGDDEVRVLSEQQKKDEEGLQGDLEELQKATELFGKGSLISPRVTDARRAVLLSSTRKLQTSAQLLQVKKQQDEFVRKLAKLDDQRRLDLLRELQETSVRLNQIREKLQSVGEKLQYTTMVRSQLVQGAGNHVEISVIRKGDKGQERITASEDTELQPGDAVEVSLHYQDGPVVSPRMLGSSNIPSGTSRTDSAAGDSVHVGQR